MSPYLPADPLRLDALRDAVRAIEASGCARSAQRLPFGIADVDEKLAGGGLAVPALHEFAGASQNLTDDAAATLFAAGLAARCPRGMVLWLMARRDLFAPAFAQAGLPPERLLYAECGRDEDVLAVMEEGLRHGGLSAVVGEVGRVTMTATRRLQLAAEDSGTMGLMLRRWRRCAEDPLAIPSAASTRWRIAPVPSATLPASGIGRPWWRVELVRQRGGPSAEWILEGTDEAGRLALPARPFDRSAAADRRGAQARHAA